MAAFGTEYMVWAPIDKEDTTLGKTYYGELTRVGALAQANLTENYASAGLSGDNIVQEQMQVFVNATIESVVTDCTLEKLAMITGRHYASSSKNASQGRAIFKPGDIAPEGGLGYIRNLLRGGKVVYEANVCARVTAAVPTSNTTTKSADGLTLEGVPINWTVLPPRAEDTPWRVVSEHETLEGAKEAIAAELAKAPGK